MQTYAPTEPAILMAAQHDYTGFAARELLHREERSVPPFRSLIRVVLRGPHEEAVQEHARRMTEQLHETIRAEGSPVRLLGPAVAPVARLKGLHRYHFQLSAETQEQNLQLWRHAAANLPRSPEVEFVVDVDPISMR